MTTNIYDSLADAIREVVDDTNSGNWKERAALVRNAIEENYLEEFLSWFEEEDNS